jgi:Nucleotide modification associated domain 1
MATNDTNFAAYGLSHPKSQPSHRDGNDKANFVAKLDHDFIANVWDTLDKAGNLLLQKHRDYGPTNISRSPGGPLNGLRVRMWDKTARINHLIDSGATPQNESLRDSFIDLLNYSAIALLVIDGKWPNE